MTGHYVNAPRQTDDAKARRALLRALPAKAHRNAVAIAQPRVAAQRLPWEYHHRGFTLLEVLLALGLSVFVYVLWYWLLKHLDASRIAIYHNIQPILASTVAYLFLGEVLSSAFLVGGAIVIFGVLIAEW